MSLVEINMAGSRRSGKRYITKEDLAYSENLRRINREYYHRNKDAILARRKETTSKKQLKRMSARMRENAKYGNRYGTSSTLFLEIIERISELEKRALHCTSRRSEPVKAVMEFQRKKMTVIDALALIFAATGGPQQATKT